MALGPEGPDEVTGMLLEAEARPLSWREGELRKGVGKRFEAWKRERHLGPRVGLAGRAPKRAMVSGQCRAHAWLKHRGEARSCVARAQC